GLAAHGPPRVASLRDPSAPRTPGGGSRHDSARVAFGEHRRPAALSARLSTAVLPPAVRLRRRAVPGGRVRRGTARDPSALSDDVRERPGRRLPRTRQGLRALRHVMRATALSEVLFAVGRRHPGVPLALLRAMPLSMFHILRRPGFQATLR